MDPAGVIRCPYRGLVPFTEQDAGTFFGRDAEIRVIGANLLAARLTLLYGDSGVGKSSILHAGVVPHLKQIGEETRRRRGKPRFQVVVVDRWQDDPLGAIADRLTETLRGALSDRPLPQREPGRLVEYLAEWTEALGGPLLFVFDQFEEYLRYHERETGDATFAEEFPRAVTSPDLKVNFLLTVREDEYARLDRFKPKLPGLFRNYLRLRYLGPAAAREAVIRPLEAHRRQHPASPTPARIEPELVEAVLEDVRAGRVVLGEAGVGAASPPEAEVRIQTPYLQLVLTRVWQAEADAASPVMRLTTYRNLGGAERIVRSHLDRVLGAFSPGEQALAAAVFRHLVTPSGAKLAHSLTDLADYARAEPAPLQLALDRLCGSIRVLRPVAPSREQPGVPRYEIYTDSLARPVLDWGNRFRRAREQEETDAKLAEERRRKLIYRRLSLGMAVAFVVAATLGTVAWLNWREATVRELIGRADAQLARDPEQSLRSMVEAADLMWLQPAGTKSLVEQKLRTTLLASHRRPIDGDTPAGLIRTNDWEWASNEGRLKFRRRADVTAVLEMQRPRPGAAADAAWEGFDTRLGGEVLHVEFSRDDSSFAVCGPEGVRWWQVANLDSGQSLFLRHTNSMVRAAAFHPDGLVLATAGDDGLTRLWSLPDGGLQQAFGDRGERVNDIAFSPDGRFLALAGAGHHAVVRDVAGKMAVAALRGGTRAAMQVDFSADGQFVWTKDSAGEVRRWASRTGQIVTRVPPQDRLVVAEPMTTSLVFVSTGNDRSRLWRQSGSAAAKEIASLDYVVREAAFSGGGSLAALAGGNNEVTILELEHTSRVVGTLVASNRVIGLGFAPNPEGLATVDRDGRALVWDWRTRRHGPVFQGSRAQDGHVVMSRTSDRLVVAGGNVPMVFALDGTTASIPVVTNGVAAFQGHEGIVKHLALSPDGAKVLSVDNQGLACLWRLSDARLLGRFQNLSGQGMASLCGSLSPDGRFLLTGGEAGTALLWDAAQTNAPLAELAGHADGNGGGVVSAWFATDGRNVFTAGHDGTIRRHETAELVPFKDLVMLAQERLRVTR